MAASTSADKGAERHPYGPRPLAALLPALTKAAFRRRSPLAQRLLADWETIVGPAVAAVTVPARCAGGVLTIFCSGPIALELQHFAPKLIERINRHFGRVLVERLTFRQVPPVFSEAPARPAVQVDEATLQASVADLAEGPLRNALLQLGRAMGSGKG